jgi:hypothetical protein
MRCPRRGLHPSFVHRVVECSLRSVPEHSLANAPPWRVGSPPPQGPSLGSRLFCPGPSSLNRPHPPHSWTHRDFTVWRLIRDAFAVRERLGDPRAVPGFRCPFSPGMPSSMTPGSSTSSWFRSPMPTWPSPRTEQLGTPKTPAIRFTRGTYFGASRFALRCGLPGCSPPFDGSDQVSPAPEGFYFQAFGQVGHPSCRWI